MTFGARRPCSDNRQHRCVIARAHVGLHDAAGRPFGDRRGSKGIIEPPADVPGAKIPPWRPPRKQIRIVGIEPPSQIHELRAEECFEERALLGALSHRVRLPLLGMHVHLAARDVHVAAENQLSATGLQPGGPITEARYEGELRRVVLAAVWHIDRRNYQIAMLDLDDARFHVERRMAEDRIDGEEVFADVQRHARVAFQGVPVRVIVRQLAFGGDLGGGGLQLLQADHVRAVTLQPFTELRRAGPNAVDVPGRDSHPRTISWWSRSSLTRTPSRGYGLANLTTKESSYAEDHAIPVVRQQRRRGGAILRLGLQEFPDPQCQSLRRRGAGPERLRHGRELPARGPAVHGAERWPTVQVQRGLLIRREL